jgi:hypothetical protein
MTEKKDGFWGLWLVLAAVIAFFLLSFMGCDAPEPEIKVVTKEEKSELLAKELKLPPGAKNVNALNEEWHTFDLVIDGRTRRFLRRIYGMKGSNGQYESATEAFTELTPQ